MHGISVQRVRARLWLSLQSLKLFCSSLFHVGNRIVESSVSSPCALCLCAGGSSYPLVITSGKRHFTTETQSSQSTHRAPNPELENHSNLRLATGNSEEPTIYWFAGCFSSVICPIFNLSFQGSASRYQIHSCYYQENCCDF